MRFMPETACHPDTAEFEEKICILLKFTEIVLQNPFKSSRT